MNSISTERLSRKSIKKLIAQYPNALFVEKWTVSENYFLKLKQPDGNYFQFGKINVEVLNRFKYEKTDHQPKNDKCTWYKFI